ncbi:MAG: polyprenyl synthetase family protein, partial [Bacteroidota bacterium]|nr:polyprenyl synthetase family protein [Bacteroidota bacterium]
HEKWSENIAILSGDAMSIMAYELLQQTKAEFLPEILRVFNQTALEVCDGQQYDMDYENSPDIAIDDYLNMIRLKTSVLIAGSLKIGAILGGACINDSDLMYDFGLNLGLSFQLRDDYLDVFGDEETFGKNIGGDIVANKKTFLLLKAFELANDMQKHELSGLLSTIAFDREEKISAVKKIYYDLHVADHLKIKMEAYYKKSLAAFDAVNVEQSKKEELKKFAANLMKRDK